MTKHGTFQTIMFFAIFALIGIVALSLESNRKLFLRILETTERIDLKPVETGIRKIEGAQAECYLRLSSIETELEEYKYEQEKRYRDVVRKVLDLDNKLNRKFKLLGEAIIKLNKKTKE
jgi:hypothetical protein